MSIIYIRYRLIPPRENDIVNSRIPSKPRLHTRFGSTMTKYALTSTPTKVGVEGNVIHEQTMEHT